MLKRLMYGGVVALVLTWCMDMGDAPLPAEPEAPALEIAFQGGPRPRPESWVDGELFAGVVTPASFNPESDPFDELYTCGGAGTFKDGVPLISESKPGDQDYNGGRWHLNVLKDDVDLDKYSGASSFEELDPRDFDSTDMYFECPLLPRRSRGRR